MKKVAKSQFLRFAIVGGLGFLIDFGSVFLMLKSLNLSPLWARLPAWFIAVTVTYAVNTTFTFRDPMTPISDRRILKSYMPYIFSQAIGGTINVATYSLFILTGFGLLTAVLAGTSIGLILNYAGAALVMHGNKARGNSIQKKIDYNY